MNNGQQTVTCGHHFSSGTSRAALQRYLHSAIHTAPWSSIRYTAALLSLCAVFIGSWSAVGTAEDDNASEPHLLFKKTVVVKPYRNGRAYAESHTIRPGEHLWKILRDHYRLDNAAIAFYCTMARDINPDIHNINDLKAHQNILVPYNYVREAPRMQPAARTKDFVPHAVRAGEYLGSILREHCCAPEELLFKRQTMQRLEKENPHIADMNALVPGQTIRIPADLCTCRKNATEDIGDAARVKNGVSTGERTPQYEPANGGDEHRLASDAVISSAAESGNSTLPDDEVRVRAMLSGFVHTFDGTDNNTGRSVFSIGGRGTLALDREAFPVYEFPWGKRIVFDYGERLSNGMQEVIAGSWNNAEIVSVRRRDDMATILEKVLEHSGFFRVERGGDYTVNRNNVQISVAGNWIVFKDMMLKNVFVVNLVEDGDTGVPESLKNYFKETGLNIVDIHAAGGGTSAPRPAGTTAERSMVHCTDPIAMTDSILGLVGIKFRRDDKKDVSPGVGQGFSLEVIADRSFEKDYETHVIDFHNLPRKIADILRGQGIKVLQIDPKTHDRDGVIRSVLSFCGARYKMPPVKFAYDRNGSSRMTVTVPGYLLESPSGDVLITAASLPDDVRRFLAEIDVKVIGY